MTFGQTPIDQIKLDMRARDEIPKLLLGLQHIYCDQELREKVFVILKNVIPEDTDSKNGRPGMDLWKILVMGTIRLNCNWDYDKLREMVNNHRTLRQMLGHGMMDDDITYPLQTLKDNVRLLTPDILDKINTLVVQEGHKLLMKKTSDEEVLMGRCDSFVVETDVHFPTDINLLFDAVRKMIQIAAIISQGIGTSMWRQSAYNIKKFKRLYRIVQRLKHSTSADEKKKAKRARQIMDAHKAYIELAEKYISKAELTIEMTESSDIMNEARVEELQTYINYALWQIGLIKRRVLQDEKIPHKDKIFSIFEPHTEWISKGKAGVPQELGLRVCILEDQYGFILHHRVMEQETDDKVAVAMVTSAQNKFSGLKGCSFDKGFYTPGNKKDLKDTLSILVLPKKGRCNKAEFEEETADDFIRLKRKHSAVESAINGLENHGLDRCPDHGIQGFKRYVGLSVLARNLQIMGHHIQQKRLKQLQRSEQRKAA
nr:ISNCY-like element ISDph1 family transposase [Desulfotignum phosphitoxidans]